VQTCALPIYTALFGYWYGIIKDGSDFFGIEALDINRKTDSTYSVVRYGKAIKGDIILPDTAYFTAYTSHIGDKRYMSLESSILTTITKGKKQAPVVKTETVYYIAMLDRRHDTLVVKTLAENFLPVHKTFHSSEELKQTVTELIEQNRSIYDDIYSLSYRKIPKPQPIKPF